MQPALDLSSRFALDTQGLGDVRRLARQNDPQALKTVAQQFEGMFLNILLKSMRATVPQNGMFDNQQTEMYTALLDQQLSQQIASRRSIGLAKVLETQLQRQQSQPPVDAAMAPAMPAKTAVQLPLAPSALAYPLQKYEMPAAGLPLPPLSGGGAVDGAAGDMPKAFVDRLWPHAAEAGKKLGVPPHFLLAHAALETGWGKREILNADGSSSYNLFGIKAGASWQGKTASALTTEYVNGQAQKQVERFRAYGSYAESFADYAGMLRNNPRYAHLFAETASARDFAYGLQKGGYATDPMYADKLMRIIDGAALRQALA